MREINWHLFAISSSIREKKWNETKTNSLARDGHTKSEREAEGKVFCDSAAFIRWFQDKKQTWNSLPENQKTDLPPFIAIKSFASLQLLYNFSPISCGELILERTIFWFCKIRWLVGFSNSTIQQFRSERGRGWPHVVDPENPMNWSSFTALTSKKEWTGKQREFSFCRQLPPANKLFPSSFLK